MRIRDLITALEMFALRADAGPDTSVIITTYTGSSPDRPADCIQHEIQEVYFDNESDEIQVSAVYEPTTTLTLTS